MPTNNVTELYGGGSCFGTSPSSASSSPIPSPPSDDCCTAAFSSSNFLYLRRLFLAALSARFFLTVPTMAVRLSSPLYSSSSRAASRSRAVLRFCSRDRVAWHFMTMPVGRCLSWTAEEVLFCRRGGKFVEGGRGGERGAYNLLTARPAAFEKGLFKFRLGGVFGALGHSGSGVGGGGGGGCGEGFGWGGGCGEEGEGEGREGGRARTEEGPVEGTEEGWGWHWISCVLAVEMSVYKGVLWCQPTP